MGNKAVEEKGIQVAEDMVVVQGFEIQVMGHTAHTGHTCMDYSLLALAFGNTCVKKKKKTYLVATHCLCQFANNII